MPDLTADQLIEILGLQPHVEGGRFTETYRAPEVLSAGSLPGRYGGERALSTAIYYLLPPGTFSEIHRLRTDEVYHFYMGDPVEMLLLHPEGSGEVVRLGTDLAAGERPQLVVGRGTWHGSRVAEGGRYGLLGCTMAPGFEYDDFAPGRRADLIERYPRHRDLIEALTRDPQ
jgi:predicted cupin superfamily sugar epimerase